MQTVKCIYKRRDFVLMLMFNKMWPWKCVKISLIYRFAQLEQTNTRTYLLGLIAGHPP